MTHSDKSKDMIAHLSWYDPDTVYEVQAELCRMESLRLSVPLPAPLLVASGQRHCPEQGH